MYYFIWHHRTAVDTDWTKYMSYNKSDPVKQITNEFLSFQYETVNLYHCDKKYCKKCLIYNVKNTLIMKNAFMEEFFNDSFSFINVKVIHTLISFYSYTQRF